MKLDYLHGTTTELYSSVAYKDAILGEGDSTNAFYKNDQKACKQKAYGPVG